MGSVQRMMRPTRLIVVAVVALLALAVGAYALLATSPAKAPRPEAPDAGGLPLTDGQLLEQEHLLREMTAARNAMQRALDRYKGAPEKDAAGRAAALRDFEEAKKRFERLKERFDAAGKPPAAR